ncbi:hypothetical protein Goklo_014967, partial [Gossypium klotzschianum]|nr:hypothetical protein [Gossypium klotzschianum]
IVGIPPPCPTVGLDKVIWGSTSTRTFTLNNAHGKIREKSWNPKEAIWQLPWKFQDVPHVLRDCPAARDIWKHIIPKDKEMSIGNAFLDSLRGIFVEIVTFSHSKLEEFCGIEVKGGSLVLTDFWGFILLLRLSYETNSMEAIKAIQEQASSGSELALVRRIHQLLSIIEYWTTRHIPREYNKEANGIAKLVQERREDY